MAAWSLFLSLLFATLISARNNFANQTFTTTITQHVTDAPGTCTTDAPNWVHPFVYSPCESCSPCLITNLQQPITSVANNSGALTNYVARFSDWNFNPTKTVTVLSGSGPSPKSQIQTWAEKEPTISLGPQGKDNTAEYHHQCERVIEYVVEQTPQGKAKPVQVTITSTSTVTSVFVSTCPCHQPTSVPGQQGGQNGPPGSGAGNQPGMCCLCPEII